MPPIYIIDPKEPVEGCLTLVSNGDEAVKELAAIERDLRPRRFLVRATIDSTIPLTGELQDLLRDRPFDYIRLNEDPLQIYLHQGGSNATYFKLVGDSDHLLLYIEVTVESQFPSRALLLGRTAINQLLDTESRNWNLPMVIARLDLLHEGSDLVLGSEVVLPARTRISYGPLGGVHQSRLFAPWFALLREGRNATSPFYKLLCAWRAYDGVQHLRKSIKKQADALGVSEKLPKDPELDLTVLRDTGASEDFLSGVKRASDLFGKLTEMRIGVGHFLLDSGEHVYMSDARAHQDYSIAAVELLRAAGRAITELQQFYGAHIENKILIGSMLPETKHADRYTVRDPQLSPQER